MNNMIPAWEKGNLTPIEKLEVHKRGLRHKAISVFIISGSETLIQKRALTKYHTPGLWANACCTHPFWKEKPIDCAQRRISEELGIHTKLNLIYRDQIEYRAEVGNGLIEHELVDIFTLNIGQKNEIEIHLNLSEVIKTRWVEFDILVEEIEKNATLFTPWLRIYLKDHADQILNK